MHQQSNQLTFEEIKGYFQKIQSNNKLTINEKISFFTSMFVLNIQDSSIKNPNISDENTGENLATLFVEMLDGHYSLLSENSPNCDKESISNVKLLIQNGLNFNHKDRNGNTFIDSMYLFNTESKEDIAAISDFLKLIEFDLTYHIKKEIPRQNLEFNDAEHRPSRITENKIFQKLPPQIQTKTLQLKNEIQPHLNNLKNIIEPTLSDLKAIFNKNGSSIHIPTNQSDYESYYLSLNKILEQYSLKREELCALYKIENDNYLENDEYDRDNYYYFDFQKGEDSFTSPKIEINRVDKKFGLEIQNLDKEIKELEKNLNYANKEYIEYCEKHQATIEDEKRKYDRYLEEYTTKQFEIAKKYENNNENTQPILMSNLLKHKNKSEINNQNIEDDIKKLKNDFDKTTSEHKELCETFKEKITKRTEKFNQYKSEYETKKSEFDNKRLKLCEQYKKTNEIEYDGDRNLSLYIRHHKQHGLEIKQIDEKIQKLNDNAKNIAENYTEYCQSNLSNEAKIKQLTQENNQYILKYQEKISKLDTQRLKLSKQYKEKNGIEYDNDFGLLDIRQFKKYGPEIMALDKEIRKIYQLFNEQVDKKNEVNQTLESASYNNGFEIT